MLAIPHSQAAYTIDTGVCDKQNGRGLLQKIVDGVNQPIGYRFHPLNDAERTYDTNDCECPAVVWALFVLPTRRGALLVSRPDSSQRNKMDSWTHWLNK